MKSRKSDPEKKKPNYQLPIPGRTLYYYATQLVIDLCQALEATAKVHLPCQSPSLSLLCRLILIPRKHCNCRLAKMLMLQSHTFINTFSIYRLKLYDNITEPIQNKMTHKAFKTKQEGLKEEASQLKGQWPTDKTKSGHTKLKLSSDIQGEAGRGSGGGLQTR